ncbi:MBL fold metallo-hydrolase [bacterium]|nr:MBL fold metallo-hydrolase [bacterium]
MELFKDFYFLQVEKTGFVDSSSFLAIRDDNGIICIDVGGGGEENIARTVGLLEKNDLNIADIHTVIISHTHADHMGAIAWFLSKQGNIKVITHEADARYLRDNTKLNHIFESDITEKYFPENKFDVIAFYQAFCPISEATEDRTVVEGDTLNCGDYSFEVIHTPGHHPGHISLYEPNVKALFVGDMAGLEVPFYNVRAGGIEGMISTMHKYQKLDIDIIIPSHGELVRNPMEIVETTLSKLKKREERLIAALSNIPVTFKELLPVLFRHEALYVFPGVGILRAHLEKLKKEGTVVEENQGYRLA